MVDGTSSSQTSLVVSAVLATLLISTSVIVFATPTVVATQTTTVEPGDRAKITAIYPNPVTIDDPGEFVVLEFEVATNVSGWELTDDETNATFPNAIVEGKVVVSTMPTVARNLTDHRVYGLSGSLSLTNDGETISVRNRTGVVDSVTYGRAPQGELWSRSSAGERWTPLGRTDRPPVRMISTDIQAFVLPDAPAVPIDILATADERIFLAGYTFTSERAARHLRRAARRGLTVRLLVEDAPVGGISQRQAVVLDSLDEAGVDVQVIGGPRGRYDYQHAKYAVVDDSALVLTENWKPAGVGGQASRGWGVVIHDSKITDEFVATFETDTNWRDTESWATFRSGRTFKKMAPTNGTYPSTFAPRNLTVNSTTVLLAPDNAENGTLELLRTAQRTIQIEQVSIGSRHQPFLQASLDAARRGVEVRVLLSSAWYVREDNQRLVEWLNDEADRDSLPLSARLVQPDSAFEKVHAKGVIVDRERVVVGSMNWNNHSVRENREVMVVLEGQAVGAYYATVFESDWKSGGRQFPIGFPVAIGIGVVSARFVAKRKVSFE